MKRVLTLFLLLAAAGGMWAQADPSAGKATGDSIGCGQPQGRRQLHITFGLSGGASILSAGQTPYTLSHALFVEVPMVAVFDLTKSLRLTTGLKYRFEWAPLKYNVEHLDGTDGLQFNTTPTTYRSSFIVHHSYLGIPVELTWYPLPNEHRILSVGLDIYAAYAVSRYIKQHSHIPIGGGIDYSQNSLLLSSSDPTLLPWKLEMGLTLSSDVLGLLHGVRVFADLLPTYRNPVTGKGIYAIGMNFYL